VSTRPSRPARLFQAAIAGLFVCFLAGPAAAPAAAAETPTLTAPDPGPGDADPALYAPVLADDREGVYADTAGRLSRYRIEATLNPVGDALATIVGTLDLSYYNGTGAEQPALYFRLYANAGEYADGAIELTRVVASGERIEPRLGVGDTVAEVPLPRAVAPEQTVDLRIDFTTTIPTDPDGSYGMFKYDTDSGTYSLAHWEPLLAGYDPVSGWNLAPPSVNGDPVFTNAALYDVTLTAPSDLVVVTTGDEVTAGATDDGRTRHRFVTGPVRDFVMAADADFQSDSMTVDGTTVTSWYNPDDVEGGQEVMVYGAQSLEVYNRLFGAYPYDTMDLVQVDLGGGAAGVEFPQLLFIGGDYYAQHALTRQIPGFLEFVVSHEVGHQWWYGLVGNDQYVDAFIDEGLTNYVACVYFSEEYEPDAGAYQINLNLKLPYFTMLFGDGDQIVDQPTDDFPSQGAYGATIYGKAALGFDAIRTAIGDDAFFQALTAYAAQFRFQVATPDDLKAAFETASGQNLDELWRHWFEAKEGRQDYDAADLAQLLRDLGR
jgi:Peptidase family M1 domain